VTAVAFSPFNGALLASAAWDGTVRLRSTATGRDVVPPLRTAPKACCVVFSADGTRLATGNAAGTRLIDTATGQDVVPPMALGAPVTTLAFSPDGTMLAIGSADRTARLVSTATGSTIGAPVPHGDAVRRVAFSPDGHWWATASNDRRARLLDARTGGQVAVITHGKAVRSVDFSADSALLATGSLDGTARLIEIRTGQEVARIMHGGGVMKVAFNPQVGTHGQLLATASYRPESLVRLVDTANGITFRRLPSAKPVQSISISGDSRLMAIAGADNGACDGTAAASVGYVSVVRLSDGTVFPPVLTEAPPCRAILSSDGRLLVMSLADGAVEAMDLTPQATALGTSLLIRIRHRGPGAAVALSPDGAWVASGGEDGAVQVVDVRTGTDVVPPVRLPGAPTVLQFSDDKEWLGIACEGGTVLLAQLAGPGRTRPFSGLGQINSLVFSPDSHLLATASSDATARIIDVAGGRELEPPIKGIGNVASVAFSPDGRLLATSEDGAARLFDVATRKEVRRLKQGGQPANNVTFSPDGRFVATVNDDDTARLFAVGSGDEVSRFAQDRPITTVAYTPDGQLLAVGDSQEVTLYWADPQLVIDRLCRRQGRNMTDDEWEHYIGNGEPRRPTCAEWRTDASPALTR
jgi:WD40 repeat protein